jgi:prolipoprotein diacylglyceryltransferase
VRTIPLISGGSFPLAVRFPEGAGAYEQHRKLGLIDEQSAFSRPVHPVQLYEAALALGLCLFLHLRFDRRRWQGQVACLLVLNYAVIRFATEFLRADNAPIYFGLTLSQVISLVLGTVAILVLAGRQGDLISNQGGYASAAKQAVLEEVAGPREFSSNI